MTCCPVGRHAQADAIDRAIRAQQAASQANASTNVPSYSQIARTYGVRKATLFAHRDECLANRSGVPVRLDGVPQRTAGDADGENASGSAAVDRYAGDVPARDAEGADGQAGRATGPPSDGTDRRNASQRCVPDVAQIGAVPAQNAPGDRDTDVVVSGDGGVVVGGEGGAPLPATDTPARARAREDGKRGWDKLAHESVQQAARNLANATHDIAIHDPSMRAHGTYVEEIAEVVQAGEWEDERTVQRLTRAWKKSRLFVLQCHRDACTLIRIARGTRFEQVESSAARWMNLYKIAIQSEEGARVAAEALKGHDRVLGLVDSGTKVQINIAQSDEARAFVQIFLDEARGDPALLERIRRRLAEARDRLGDPTAILATADAAE